MLYLPVDPLVLLLLLLLLLLLPFILRSIICWDLRTEKRVSTHLQRMGGVNCVAALLSVMGGAGR